MCPYFQTDAELDNNNEKGYLDRWYLRQRLLQSFPGYRRQALSRNDIKETIS